MDGPSQHANDPSERVGRYEVLGEIASGGMATVYLARAVGAGGFARLVAIKKLHEHLQADEDFVAMLLDEARLAARIRHPNVVPVVDMEAAPSLYLVMEYIEGDKLSGLIRALAKQKRALTPTVALRIVHDSLEGLHVAHELHDDEGRPLHIIHRDISPQNILVGVDGVARITDFGIAKAESRATTTRDGQLKGKIGYMAPEQLSASAIDRRVDLFAMGVTLWESLTGRRLFHGESEVESMAAVAHALIPSLAEPPYRLTREIDHVVQRSLARDPTKRFSTAREFADALESAAASIGGLASTRQVADVVNALAGEKIQRERERMRHASSVASFASTVTPVTSSRKQNTPAPFAPDEAGVRSGISVASQQAPLAPGPARATHVRWIVAAAIAAVIVSSLLTAMLVLRYRAVPQPARSTAAAPVPLASHATTTPPAPVVSPAITPPAVPDAGATATVANHEADAGAPATSASPASRAGRGNTRRGRHGFDDSDFIGVNPYMH
jgi:serine/threonine-protein kinase